MVREADFKLIEYQGAQISAREIAMAPAARRPSRMSSCGVVTVYQGFSSLIFSRPPFV